MSQGLPYRESAAAPPPHYKGLPNAELSLAVAPPQSSLPHSALRSAMRTLTFAHLLLVVAFNVLFGVVRAADPPTVSPVVTCVPACPAPEGYDAAGLDYSVSINISPADNEVECNYNSDNDGSWTCLYKLDTVSNLTITLPLVSDSRSRDSRMVTTYRNSRFVPHGYPLPAPPRSVVHKGFLFDGPRWVRFLRKGFEVIGLLGGEALIFEGEAFYSCAFT